MSEIPLSWYLGISAVLFFLGLVTILARRNLVYILLGVELILNAASLNFVAFSRYAGGALEDAIGGQIVSIFIIMLAAAEAAVALAIVLNIYNNFLNVDVDTPSNLKE